MGDSENDIFFNDLWTFYFHDPFDSDWNLPSYQKITDLSSIDCLWSLQKQIGTKINCGMFFCMREHIFPCWDDPSNINGSCMSIKVLKQNVPDFWEFLMIHMLGETLIKEEFREEYWNKVNGISVSSKKSFCIIKLWLADHDITTTDFFNLPDTGFYGSIIFKSNNESLQINHSKKEQ